MQKGDEKARDMLIEHNLLLVAHIAKKYAGAGVDMDDLISIGTIGLIKAVGTFSYEKSRALSSYAAKCIENEILMYFRSQRKSSQDVSLSDYIETGSLVSIKANVSDIVIPSEERHIKMYPLDFEEFLWANGNETLMPLIRQSFIKQRPLGDMIHRKAMDYFRQYLIIGGMPQAVKEYAENKNFVNVDAIKRDILTLYRADIIKHAKGYERKVEAIFDEIPSQLQKHEKRFNLASIGKQARFREYEDAMFWLEDAMIVNICYNSTAPSAGLKMNSDRMTLKCYMADTGLLISHAFDENSIVSEEVYKKLLLGKLEFNEGMIVENIVAQMLVASDHRLYFYSNPSRDDASERMEIDFLISKSKITNRHNVSPIEVKSSKNYTTTSLDKFSQKFSHKIQQQIIIHPKAFSMEANLMKIPPYMIFCL